MSTPPRWQPLFDALAQMRDAWPKRGWSWDSRFDCVASSFTSTIETEARAAAAKALPTVWTHTNISSGPPLLRELAESSGGVRAGQLILTSVAPGGYTAYGLWWPWGDGVSISLRVGIVGVGAAREPSPSFRDLFHVTM